MPAGAQKRAASSSRQAASSQHQSKHQASKHQHAEQATRPVNGERPLAACALKALPPPPVAPQSPNPRNAEQLANQGTLPLAQAHSGYAGARTGRERAVVEEGEGKGKEREGRWTRAGSG